MERENMWKQYSPEQLAELEEVSSRYKECLNLGKTERECVALAISMAEAKGYKNLKDCIAGREELHPGDKVYAERMGKILALFMLGDRPLEEGMNILGAHIDSPRLDVKQNPLYEDADMAYLDTHYYGGIKNYQWTAIPLALHGTVSKKDGTVQTIVIGEKDDEPVLVVSDLLVHLAGEQMDKRRVW